MNSTAGGGINQGLERKKRRSCNVNPQSGGINIFIKIWGHYRKDL